MAARTVQLSNRLVAIVVRVARADVAELVDAHGSGPCGGNPVEVRVLSSALRKRACGSPTLRAGRPRFRGGDGEGRSSSRPPRRVGRFDVEAEHHPALVML